MTQNQPSVLATVSAVPVASLSPKDRIPPVDSKAAAAISTQRLNITEYAKCPDYTEN
mgnify:CR=1 FL=1